MTEFRYLNICTVYKCEWWAEIHKLISGNKCAHLSSICICTCIMNALIILNLCYLLKEERFLYPVYPLLAFMAACTLSSIAYLSEQIADSQLSKYPKRSSKKRKKWWTIGLAFRTAVLITTYSITALVCVSRIAANYRNYRGTIFI